MTTLFEILIPVASNEGIAFDKDHNEKWADMVLKLAGGLTIFGPVDGYWRSPSGEVFKEQMMPVRIACSQEQIEQIADFSASHYKQQAIMYSLVSTNVIIKNYE